MGTRRVLLAGLAAAMLASPALAQDTKVVDATKVFTFYENFLQLPAAERTRFRLVYTFTSAGQPVTAPAWLVVDGRRTPMPLRDGQVLRLPNLDELRRGKVELGLPADAKVSAKLAVEPTVRPAARMDARELAAAVTQAAAGLKKAAGFMAMAVPSLTRVDFAGVPAGEVELADGRRAPLPMENGRPVFEPAKFPGARAVRFRRAPDHLRFGGGVSALRQ